MSVVSSSLFSFKRDLELNVHEALVGREEDVAGREDLADREDLVLEQEVRRSFGKVTPALKDFYKNEMRLPFVTGKTVKDIVLRAQRLEALDREACVFHVAKTVRGLSVDPDKCLRDSLEDLIGGRITQMTSDERIRELVEKDPTDIYYRFFRKIVLQRTSTFNSIEKD